jgi:lysophospholipase L1-like esterase
MATDWNRIFARPLEKKALAAPNPSAPATSAPVAPQAAVPPPVRWENEIAAFEKADREQPPVPGGVAFLGSSNIRMWTTMAEDFAGMHPLNRGVGGARLVELAPAALRLVAAAKPAVVVVSAGSNDVAAGATADEVRAAFEHLVDNLRRELPEVRVAFLAIAPSIQRWPQWERQQAANAAVRECIASRGADAGLAYIDANQAFLDGEGKPAAECFLDDQLHPSTIGNARRAAIMRPLLLDLMP